MLLYPVCTFASNLPLCYSSACLWLQHRRTLPPALHMCVLLLFSDITGMGNSYNLQSLAPTSLKQLLLTVVRTKRTFWHPPPRTTGAKSSYIFFPVKSAYGVSW